MRKTAIYPVFVHHKPMHGKGRELGRGLVEKMKEDLG